MKRFAIFPDIYTFLLIGTVVLASALPASGVFADIVGVITTFAIALLFFLHGAKLSRKALVDGLTHWRLHLLILSCTFILFPIMGFALRPVFLPLVNEDLYMGVLFLCMLPATVQSAVALTGIAGGNVPASVCSASLSTLLGIFITPFLVSWLVIPTEGTVEQWDAVIRIFVQLMLPFLAGHFLRPYFDSWFKKVGGILTYVDRGSILLVVYSAFSAAVVGGIWQQVSMDMLLGLVVISAVMLAISMVLIYAAAWRLGFSFEDRVTALFGGAQKSLASGIPMAQVLFVASTAGTIVLPLMLFHLFQLLVSSALAQRWRRRRAADKLMPTL